VACHCHLRIKNGHTEMGLSSGYDQLVYCVGSLVSDHASQNIFGNTECGAMLSSDGSNDRSVRPLDGVSYAFVPISPVTSTESGHQSNARLLELVILSNSGDCPDPSLRHSDGHLHTGDLFQEVKPGSYIFRGRDDDWIKSENSLRCDTKYVLSCVTSALR
jgi:acyl-coenzyme A synthetase/AMP-(fatty) acid ligase